MIIKNEFPILEYDDENEDGDEDNFSEMSYNENDLFKSYDIVNVDYSSK